MRWTSPLQARRYASIWRDPRRAALTLQSFAATEEDGGLDLGRAAGIAEDAFVREHLGRHAKDEVRHATLFRERAENLRSVLGGQAGGAGDEPGRAFDLTQARLHGGDDSALVDEDGFVSYIAFLHIAEKKAAVLFSAHGAAARRAGDAATGAIFDAVLRDEKYHVAWTGQALARWRANGRDFEVERALSDARRGRWLKRWRALGLRSASGVSKLTLRAMFFTVLAPFGWIAARSGAPKSWQSPPPSDPSSMA